MRGVYWTIPDEKEKKLLEIFQSKSQNILNLFHEFKNTYFKEVYKSLKKNLK